VDTIFGWGTILRIAAKEGDAERRLRVRKRRKDGAVWPNKDFRDISSPPRSITVWLVMDLVRPAAVQITAGASPALAVMHRVRPCVIGAFRPRLEFPRGLSAKRPKGKSVVNEQR
jgi:hypothetical protein